MSTVVSGDPTGNRGTFYTHRVEFSQCPFEAEVVSAYIYLTDEATEEAKECGLGAQLSWSLSMSETLSFPLSTVQTECSM